MRQCSYQDQKLERGHTYYRPEIADNEYYKEIRDLLSKGYISEILYNRAITVLHVLIRERMDNFDCLDYVPSEEVSFSCFSKDLSITIYVMEDRITIAYAGRKSGIIQKVDLANLYYEYSNIAR